MEASISSVYLPKLISPTPIEGYFKIEFDNGKSSLYLAPEAAEKVERLRASFDFFNPSSGANTYSCPPGSSSELFAATFGIASENKTVKEALTPIQKQDPRIFEILHRSLSIFYPSTCLELSKSLLTQFFTMDLRDAHAIVNAPEKEPSYAKVLARKKVKSAIYFASEEKADICSDLKERKQVMRSPNGLLQASKHINHDNPLIRSEARKAHQLLQMYQKKITQALENAGADISNEQLMEHIIGPKNFLFSHYGIVLSNDTAERANPFCYVPVLHQTCITEQGLHLASVSGLNFSLKNIFSPKDLERDIRSKILSAMGLEEDYDADSKLLSLMGLEEDSEFDFGPPLFYDPRGDLYCSIGFFPRRLILRNADKNPLEQALTSISSVCSPAIEDLSDSESDVALKQRKKAIYFSNFEKAQAWLNTHPDPQDFKKYKMSPWALQHAVRHFDIDDTDIHPEIQLAAFKADTVLNVYIKSIRDTLQGSGAKMDEGILEHITGPKDFIFSRFGIVPKDKSRLIDKSRLSNYPFRFIPGAIHTCIEENKLHIANYTPLGYTLNDPDPEALKQEILSDIIKITNNNPTVSFDQLPE